MSKYASPPCGHCGLPVDMRMPGIRHMGTSVAHPYVSICLDATRMAARAWQALRDWLDGTVEQWHYKCVWSYDRGHVDGYEDRSANLRG